MLNLIITPWFRILAAERDGAAELRSSLAAAAELRREREAALEFSAFFFSHDGQVGEKPVLAFATRAG